MILETIFSIQQYLLKHWVAQLGVVGLIISAVYLSKHVKKQNSEYSYLAIGFIILFAILLGVYFYLGN